MQCATASILSARPPLPSVRAERSAREEQSHAAINSACHRPFVAARDTYGLRRLARPRRGDVWSASRGLPIETGARDRTLWPRRNCRCHHAHGSAESQPAFRPAILHREPAGRRRRGWLAGGKGSGARRLYAGHGRRRPHHRQGAVQVAALQYRDGFHADIDDGLLWAGDRGQSRFALQDHQGRHRRRQDASR